MCYNCGCGSVGDDMGNPDNITSLTFERASKAWGQTVDDAKIETYKLLKKEMERKKKI